MAPFATEAEEKKCVVQKKEALIADRERKLRKKAKELKKEALDAKHVAVQLQLTAGQHDRIVNGSYTHHPSRHHQACSNQTLILVLRKFSIDIHVCK